MRKDHSGVPRRTLVKVNLNVNLAHVPLELVYRLQLRRLSQRVSRDETRNRHEFYLSNRRS